MYKNINMIFKIGRCADNCDDMRERFFKVKKILDDLTDDDIIIDATMSSSPMLHELCEKHVDMFRVLQLVWSYPKFKTYWSDDTYVDKYGLTPFERLSVAMYGWGANDITDWIKKNMGIIPSRYECRNGHIFLLEPFRIS